MVFRYERVHCSLTMLRLVFRIVTPYAAIIRGRGSLIFLPSYAVIGGGTQLGETLNQVNTVCILCTPPIGRLAQLYCNSSKRVKW